MDIFLGAAFIFSLRICDVSLGTLRTMFTVQGKKYLSAGIGFVEVSIWVIAIRQVFSQLDNPWNIFGYSLGFAAGTFLGILIEQKLALGYTQVIVISRHHPDAIADALRLHKFGVTLIPGEGGSGGMALITSVIRRNRMREFHDIVDEIDHQAFISMQSANLSRGFVPKARK
jgi:uncharacterized protein YebE (UPF0316 family)